VRWSIIIARTFGRSCQVRLHSHSTLSLSLSLCLSVSLSVSSWNTQDLSAAMSTTERQVSRSVAFLRPEAWPILYDLTSASYRREPRARVIDKPLASVRLLRSAAHTADFEAGLKQSAYDINIAHSGNEHAQLTQLLSRSNLLQRVNTKQCQRCNKFTAIT